MFKKAKPIWISKDTKSERYADFYADFKVEFPYLGELKGKSLIFNVAAENDYAAYLNGKLVSFGAYKGYPQKKFYNSVDLTGFVSDNKNELVITVWHEGINTARSICSGAGVIFEAVIKDKKESSGGQKSEKPAYNAVNGTFDEKNESEKVLFFSDENVLCRKNPQYKSGYKKLITEQLGYSFLYDATANTAEPWQKCAEVEFDCEYIARPVKNLVLKPPVSSRLIKKEKTLYLFDLEKETAGHLYLDFLSDRSQKLLITYSEKLTEKGYAVRFVGKRDFSVEYIASKGENLYFNPFLRLGLRYIQIECDGEITPRQITVRPNEYPLEEREFYAENQTIKEITQTAIRTLRLCMHEHYEDCPWREQALYSLDSRNEMLCDYTAFKNNFDYARANLVLMSYGARADGFLELTYPAVNTPAIPLYSLSYIVQLYEYVLFSGDRSVTAEVKPVADKIMQNFREIADNGLIADFPYPFWNFYEWQKGSDNANDLKRTEKTENGENKRYSLILNAFYVYAENAYSKLLGEPSRDLTAFKNSMREAFYDKESGLFRAYKGENFFTEFGNSLAVLTDLAGEDTAKKLIAAKIGGGKIGGAEVYPSTLAAAAFYYDALLSFGDKYEKAVETEIVSVYKKMLDAGATSLWETADDVNDLSCSLCHGWSALPIYYFARLKKIVFKP